jgi:acetyltransferase-like isoleucine patch superfamily enzyme
MKVRDRTLRDLLPHVTCTGYYWLRAGGTTLVGRLLARVWGIEMGRGCVFRGLPLLRRMPGSTIRIGNRCRFNSRSEYNYIGINHPCILSTHSDDAVLVVGDGCGFSGTVIGCAKSIRLGNRVRCGANTVITDTDWHTSDPRTTPPEDVVVEDDVWLGLNVVVLKGVTIGRGSVIGANSLVTRSIPARVVAAGSPARVIRTLDTVETR